MNESSIKNLEAKVGTDALPEEVIHLNEGFYVLATSSHADDRTRVLNQGDTFAVFDRYGDIHPIGMGEQGVFHQGTRFVSRLELRLGQKRPLLLSSNINEDNTLLVVDLTNTDFHARGDVLIPRGTIHLERSKFLWKGVCYERLRLSNYSNYAVDLHLSLRLDADYADIFEVRGVKREKRGQRLPPLVENKIIHLRYEGLDHVVRCTQVSCDPLPDEMNPTGIRYEVLLQPQGQQTYTVAIRCSVGDKEDESLVLPYDQAYLQCLQAHNACFESLCGVHSTNEQFNDWFQRSLSDLNMMINKTEHGLYPYAGVPWFCTVFGRDGIIAALQMLWVNPGIAKDVLCVLAATQATQSDSVKDAEPGKIVHEMRKGEMAALGEIPFGLYYGSVDSTPLFIMLADAYYERTGDLGFIRSIWSNVERALVWIDESGDVDGDGFVEYERKTGRGLINQGWKDSQDSVFHADGILAEAPIALCEVQGYVYAAKKGAGRLAGALGFTDQSLKLQKEAEDLQKKFLDVFWCEEISAYAMALDGNKKPCRVATSNVGHCLFTGIAAPDHARRIADLFLTPEFFSGWGVRTVPMNASRYNPMSYHNGSIWPHDNAIISMGLARYGLKELTLQMITGLFESSLTMELYRLPELFCGFMRQHGQAPTLYPVACSPQAWASGSIFMLLQACLGLSINAPESRICFYHPVLPHFIDRLWIRDLKVNGASVEVLLERHEGHVSINVLRRQGKVEVMSIM